MRAKLRKVNSENEPTLGGDELDEEIRDMDRKERQTRAVRLKAMRSRNGAQ
jgi:hypothetical protein